MPRYFTVFQTEGDRYSIACQKQVTASLCFWDCDLHKGSRWKTQQGSTNTAEDMLLWWFMYERQKIIWLKDKCNSRGLICHNRLNKNRTSEAVLWKSGSYSNICFQTKRFRIKFRNRKLNTTELEFNQPQEYQSSSLCWLYTIIHPREFTPELT